MLRLLSGNQRLSARIWIGISFIMCCVPLARGELGQPSRSFVVSLDDLSLAKQLYGAGDAQLTQDVNRLVAQANSYLNLAPVSVRDADRLPPSNDRQDYMSYAAYWWPNPDAPDGLPWMLRDGFVNLDNYEDFASLQKLSRYTEATSLAYYFTGDEIYATKTAELLRTWFIDESTRMSPRNEYAHMFPGADTGSYDVAGFGNRLPSVYDAAGLIESSAAWTAEDQRQMQTWTRDFLNWAKTSTHGHDQGVEPSNHGTNYDFLHTLFALYIDDQPEAISNIRHYFTDRLDGQVAADGSNPLEMKRANNLLYHRYNLGRAFELAALSQRVDDLDGFEYQLDDGRGLRLALDFLIPYMTGQTVWDRFPDAEFPTEPSLYYALLRKAAVYFDDIELLELARQFPYTSFGFVNLTHPSAAVDKSSGDVDADGMITVADIDQLAGAIRANQTELRFDLNRDNRVDAIDHRYWLALAEKQPGDANLDGTFNSLDLINVFEINVYEDQIANNATWGSGDWNGDGEFTTQDLIAAFLIGGFDAGTDAESIAVPEPSAVSLGLGGGLVLACSVCSSVNCRRRR